MLGSHTTVTVISPSILSPEEGVTLHHESGEEIDHERLAENAMLFVPPWSVKDIVFGVLSVRNGAFWQESIRRPRNRHVNERKTRCLIRLKS